MLMLFLTMAHLLAWFLISPEHPPPALSHILTSPCPFILILGANLLRFCPISFIPYGVRRACWGNERVEREMLLYL